MHFRCACDFIWAVGRQLFSKSLRRRCCFSAVVKLFLNARGISVFTLLLANEGSTSVNAAISVPRWGSFICLFWTTVGTTFCGILVFYLRTPLTIYIPFYIFRTEHLHIELSYSSNSTFSMKFHIITVRISLWFHLLLLSYKCSSSQILTFNFSIVLNNIL